MVWLLLLQRKIRAVFYGFAVPVIALNTTFQASENDRSAWNDTKRPLIGSSIQKDRIVGGFCLFSFGSNLRIGALVQH